MPKKRKCKANVKLPGNLTRNCKLFAQQNSDFCHNHQKILGTKLKKKTAINPDTLDTVSNPLTISELVNPFLCKVIDPHYRDIEGFVPFDELERDLSKGVSSGPRDIRFTSLIMGDAGSGKTTLLRTLTFFADSSGWLVLPLGSVTVGVEERIRELINCLIDEHFGGSWQHEAGVDAINSFNTRSMLTKLADHAAKQTKGVLLTIDDVHNCDSSEFLWLVSDIQHITRREERWLAFLAAAHSEIKGTYLMDQRFAFFHRCNRYQMPKLSAENVERFLAITIREAGGELEGKALDILVKCSEALSNDPGILPYHMHLVGYHAWKLANVSNNLITEQIAELAGEHAEQSLYSAMKKP